MNYFKKIKTRNISDIRNYRTKAVIETENYNPDQRYKELIEVLNCLILLENKHISDKYNQTERCYSWRAIRDQMREALIALDKENVDFDRILNHILEESKVLDLYVTNLDFYVDMYCTVKRLEIKYKGYGWQGYSSDPTCTLESLIVHLYSRLQKLIGPKEIRIELVFLLSALYSVDNARLIVHDIEYTIDDYTFCGNGFYEEHVSDAHTSEIDLVTVESTTDWFSDIHSNSSKRFDSVGRVDEAIRDSKKELRKRGISTFYINKGLARALRMMLLDNPKKVKPKKIRIRKSKNVVGLEEIEESKKIEEPKDSE